MEYTRIQPSQEFTRAMEILKAIEKNTVAIKELSEEVKLLYRDSSSELQKIRKEIETLKSKD